MAEAGTRGTPPLLGVSRRNPTPNTFAAWQYLLIFGVLIIGALYAAPNLFQPDPAIQIRPNDESVVVSQAQVESATAAMQAAGVSVGKIESIDGSIFIRVGSDEEQLRARDVVNAEINADGNYVVALNRASNTPQWLADIGGKPMSLGLDLSGGVHFLLQVDMQKYLGSVVASTAESMKDKLREAKVYPTPGREWVDAQTILILFEDEAEVAKAETAFEEEFLDYQRRTIDVGGKPAIRFSLSDERVTEYEDRAIAQNLVSLRNRVNELGVSEPQVQRLGRSRIVVDLPGIQDSARAKEILNKFANLEFRLAADPNTPRFQKEAYPWEGADVEILRRNIVTGNNVQDAQQSFDPETTQPQVNIELDNDGGNSMHDATKGNVGRSMAILFIEQKPIKRKVVRDGETVLIDDTREEKRLISVARIQAALGFSFRITGLGLREAQDLALLLRAGALAAPMYIVEERTVGASLGDDNIKAGQQSVLIGFVMVLIFMLFYYRWFGFAANIALAANLMLLVAIMSILGATLTLPGIAGIVLTVGMAVDANVLIFSRIREEIKERPPQQAIQAGFDRALLTITDANVTTFFVAVILLSIGSGPVRGFAVTLAVGIVTSMFTAILVTRSIINLMYGGRKLSGLKI